jgi:hypothetical protein
MRLLIIVIIAAVSGLYYSSTTNGFIFDKDICLFAGLTLIMPSLFTFKLVDIKLVWIHRVVLFKGLFVNYLFLPAVAIAIGLMTDNFGIAAGLFLLSVLSGGGMVMHWIKKSHGDTSLGFLLLFINLVSVIMSLLMLEVFTHYGVEYFEVSYYEDMNIGRFLQPVIMLLIVVPFLVSRVVILIAPLKNMIEKFSKVISQSSIFIIIFYLFGLQNSQQLFEIYEFEPELFSTALYGVVAFYLLVFIISKIVYDLKSPQGVAAFWHSITRYITLALVLSTFYTETFGTSMLLPIMMAYIIQIPLSSYVSKRYFSND